MDTSVFQADTQQHKSILNRLLSIVQQTRQFYSHESAIEQALQHVPFDLLHEQVRKDRQSTQTQTNDEDGDGDNDELLLVRALMQWFKHSGFFQWCNEPPCSTCATDGGRTRLVGMDGPRSREEQLGLASRVEVYQCERGHVTRFPRFNNPITLLQSEGNRRGRCGEWANAFAMLLSAVVGPSKVRYVMDWTDHVWVEFITTAADGHTTRIVHLDPCENAVDSPLMYESGWGKKLNLIVAVNHEMVVDVTRRYTRNWDQVEQRRTNDLGMDEQWLRDTVQKINTQLQSIAAVFGSPHDLQRIGKTLADEMLQLDEMHQDQDDLKPQEKQGRSSGSEEWRRARGELGSSDTGKRGLFPSEMFFFEEFNLKGIMGKIVEFNTAFQNSDSQTELAFSVTELRSVASLLQGKQTKAVFTEQQKDIFERALRSWPTQQIFPWIDLVRVLVLHQHGSEWMRNVFDLTLAHEGQGSGNFAVRLMLLRLFSNMFAQTSTRDMMLHLREGIMVTMKGPLMINMDDKPQVKLAYATVLCNYATTLHEHREDREVKMEILSLVLQILSMCLEVSDLGNDCQIIERLLLAAGSLLLKNDNREMRQRVHDIAQTILERIPSSSTAKELALLTESDATLV